MEEEGGSLVDFRLGAGMVRAGLDGGQIQVRQVDEPEEEETSPVGAGKHNICSMLRPILNRKQAFH